MKIPVAPKPAPILCKNKPTKVRRAVPISLPREGKVFVTCTLESRLHGGDGGRVFFLGGGVVQQKQDQVALIGTSHRLGQRCSPTCPRSSDESIVYQKSAREHEELQTGVVVFLIFFF